MIKEPDNRKIEPPKSSPKKFIIAFLPRRKEEKDTKAKRHPKNVELRGVRRQLRREIYYDEWVTRNGAPTNITGTTMAIAIAGTVAPIEIGTIVIAMRLNRGACYERCNARF